MISKEQFLKIMLKVNEYKEKQEKFCTFIESLEDGDMACCDVLIYQELIDIILYDFLVKELNDKEEIIINKFYDNLEAKFKLMSWEEIYDYLVKEGKDEKYK